MLVTLSPTEGGINITLIWAAPEAGTYHINNTSTTLVRGYHYYICET